MPDLIYTQFNGLSRRNHDLTNSNTFAEVASNTLLHDGAIRPFKCPELICEHDFQVKEIYSDKDCPCIAFDSETYIVEYKDLIFIKERNAEAFSVCKEELCDPTPLCPTLPCPETALHVSSPSHSSSCSFRPARFFYTFVSERCGCLYESPPSPITDVGSCGSPYALSNIPVPDPDLGVTSIRIYRFDSGSKTGGERANANNSGALLIAEIPAGQTEYTDTSSMSSPAHISPVTYDMEAMPKNPDGYGSTLFSLFAWEGKELYISVPRMPMLRYESGRFCFDEKIVAAKYWQGSIYVMTEKHNYRIDEGRGGRGEISYSNPPYRFENILPINNQFSVSSGAVGVFYTSNAGVVVLSGNDSAVIGNRLFHTSQWKAMRVQDVRTQVYNQFLFIYSPEWDHAHIFEFEDSVFVDNEYSNHVTYPYSIQATYIDYEGVLLFASGNDVYEFHEGAYCFDPEDGEDSQSLCADCCEYRYVIKPRHSVEITDYASGYLNIDPTSGYVTFQLIDQSCGDFVVYEATFAGCGEHQFTLPAGCLSAGYRIELSGCATVYELRLSTSGMTIGRNG